MRPVVIFAILALGFGILFPSPGQAINIAPGGVASANRYYDGNVPQQAIDGNWETPWTGDYWPSPSHPFWLTVDLQGTYEIDRIVLVGSKSSPGPNSYLAGYITLYNLYNSTNGTDWTWIASGNLIDTYDYVHTIYLTSNQSMRYAKYEAVGPVELTLEEFLVSVIHWANLSEMEIYPVGSPVPLPGSLILLGSGLLGAALWRARSKFMG